MNGSTTPRPTHYTTFIERLSYGLYFTGQNLLYIIVANYTSLFLINHGLNEALVAAILIVPKIWDAVNDPIFGVIVDKVKFKKGRFLPWLRISWAFIPLATIFFFSMPTHLPDGVKVAWAIIAYVLWDTGYTMCDAPIFALSTSMSPYPEERIAILSFGRLCATVGGIAATLGVEAVYMDAGWSLLSIILSTVAMLLMLPILIVGKERSHAEIEKAPSLKQIASGLMHNKYLIIYYGSYFLISATMTVEHIIPIFAQYVLGSTDMGTLLVGICIVPMIIAAAVVPPLTKKVDKLCLYIAAIGLFAISSIVQYFIGYENTFALYAATAVRGIGYGGFSVLSFLFTPDIVEYGHYKTGKRQEGVFFSVQTFMTKLTTAIVSSLSLVLLSLFGFAAANADKTTGMVAAAAGQGCWAVFTWVASIGSILGIPILLLAYKLRDKDVRLMAMCNNGEISKEECEEKLAKRLQ